MKKWVFILTIFCLIIFQATVLESFKLFGVKPDLMFIIMVMVAINFDLKRALIFSFIIGAAKDLFCFFPFGLNAMLFLFWAFLIKEFSRRIVLDTTVVRVAVIFLALLLNDLVLRLIFTIMGRSIALGMFLKISFLGSFYTALVGAFFLAVVKKKDAYQL